MKRIASANADTTILIWDVPGLPTLVRPAPTPPSEEKLYGLWIDLGGYLPNYQTINRLVAMPKATVPFLKRRLKPDLPRDDRVARLMADLDSDEFAVREKASRELAGMGKRAEAALRRALGEKPSPEKRRRVQALLKALQRPQDARPQRRHQDLTPEEQCLVRTAIVLDRIGTPDALDLLRYLAHATELPRILDDGSIFSQDIAPVKAALARLAERSEKP